MKSDLHVRALPAGFDAGTLHAIDERLGSIEREHHVKIALAIESGSRAWGFPSPDSDYDTRFIFVRHPEDYLSPWQKRDVIELPLEGELDINGWDLGKTLKLIVKGNAVAIEWLMSPIVYGGDREFRGRLAMFAGQHADRVGTARHYLHLGDKQRRTYFANGKQIHLKKLFYALRPAAALRWLRLHPVEAVAPMHFPTQMRESDVPRDVAAITADLIARKAETRELGTAPLPPAIERFIDEEFAIATATLPIRPRTISAEARSDADALFRWSVNALTPPSGSILSRTKAIQTA